jgi:hypothetical protein
MREINILFMLKTVMEFNINFDEASAAWRQNKLSLGNGMYKYCCIEQTKSGTKCKNKPSTNSSFCHRHKTSHLNTRIS